MPVTAVNSPCSRGSNQVSLLRVPARRRPMTDPAIPFSKNLPAPDVAVAFLYQPENFAARKAAVVLSLGSVALAVIESDKAKK